MPELPEVQTVVTTLRPKLLGRTIVSVVLNRQDIVDPPGTPLPNLLMGRTLADIQRRGKRIVMTLNDGNRFYIHLGMTGRLTIEGANVAVLPHTHLIVELGDISITENSPGRAGSPAEATSFVKQTSPARGAGSSPSRTGRQTGAKAQTSAELRFTDPRRFGGLWWLGKGPSDDGMGPEPLSLTPRELSQRLAGTTRPIKNALLDQAVLAGLGNIYVDESLFTARIHPLTPANTLSPADTARLNRAIKTTLNKAINARGSTLRDYRDADGNPGDFQTLHRVYAREGKPCANCKAPITRIVLGGRSTHFCKTCQPLPQKPTPRRRANASQQFRNACLPGHNR